jgi:hypothetical protein
MRYKVFGRHTGLRVSELVLGAGTFGTRWGDTAPSPTRPTRTPSSGVQLRCLGRPHHEAQGSY